MSASCAHCDDDRRRHEVRARQHSGLDYIEVDARLPNGKVRPQPILHLYFLAPAPTTLTPDNVKISGGRRIRDIHALHIDSPTADAPDHLAVTVDRAGDLSTYTLSLVEAGTDATPRPLALLDPCYAKADFSFAIECPSDLDCQPSAPPPSSELSAPEINYLAKDYASFRQLILDRLALIMPDWQERHAADIGIVLVELLAYVGDYLSYYQDAVATEAYLDTARQRVSVRRHARLVDYEMHEGCNARAWVCIETDADLQALRRRDVFFITATDELAARRSQVLSSDDLRGIPSDRYAVFEPAYTDLQADVGVHAAHSRIRFYTWDDLECCLAHGATRATLRDTADTPVASFSEDGTHTAPARVLHLHAGDVLIFEEVVSPDTGNPADADPSHRHVVRLTKVTPGEDPLYTPPIPVVEIEWDAADALPYEMCISATLPAPECRNITDVSVAHGNVLLVDSGRTVEEPLGPVPTASSDGTCTCDGEVVELIEVAGDSQPLLTRAPLTFRAPLPGHTAAARSLGQDPRQATPQITLHAPLPPPQEGDDVWLPQADLLNSRGGDMHFVVELDDDGNAQLRFGDGELGRRPAAGVTFRATYRIGNGPSGNVGAEAIVHMVLRNAALSGVTVRVRNPLPAQGGTVPESLPDVKLLAPHAFRARLERAITADDYATLAERQEHVQDAAAALTWTGSWYEAHVAVDPLGSETLDEVLRDAVWQSLHRYRRIGHDLVVTQAKYVGLALEMTVCVLPHFLRGHVEAALLDRFSNRRLPNGQRGFFHPDNLRFGDGVAVSALIAAAQAIAGVESVSVKLGRLGAPSASMIDDGILQLGPTEIAQLDNDPSLPEHGTLKVTLHGGR